MIEEMLDEYTCNLGRYEIGFESHLGRDELGRLYVAVNESHQAIIDYVKGLEEENHKLRNQFLGESQ